MKEFEKIEQLLMSKTYEQLTDTERALVDQELTQQAYAELRESMVQLRGEKIKVSKDVKHALMAEMQQQERGAFSLFRLKLPAYTHAVPLLVIVYLLFFMPAEEKVVMQDRIVEVTVRDTVQVTQIDTLWVERLVKVPTPVYVTQEIKPKATAREEVEKRSMSEQREVLDLVIRGE